MLKKAKEIRKVVIPVAGYGTRLFPATKAIKKEFLPIIDQHGKLKPAILHIIEEAFRAGIKEIGLVVQPETWKDYEAFFSMDLPKKHLKKLSEENREYCQYLKRIGEKITYIPQKEQAGLGHALYCAKDWVGKEPFLLMLGDHLYRSSEKRSCSKQLIDCYQQLGHSVVGIRAMSVDKLQHYGCVTGRWKEENTLLSIEKFYEKPDIDFAKEHLQIPGKGAKYCSLFGLYVLQPGIFGMIEKNILHDKREGGEFQLTSCLDELRMLEGFSGLLIQGQNFDIGIPEEYRRTFIQFSSSSSVSDDKSSY